MTNAIRTIEGVGCRAVAERADLFFGHGVAVVIYDNDNQLLGKLYFGCHPEFADFSFYQSYSSDQLFDIVADRLPQAIKKFSDWFALGGGGLLRLNSPDAEVPNNCVQADPRAGGLIGALGINEILS